MVKPETPAQAAGLALGDRVLSADGTALDGRAMAEVVQAVDSHVLEVERGGKLGRKLLQQQTAAVSSSERLVVKLRKPTPDTKLGLILTDDTRRGEAAPYVSKLRPGAIADASGQFKIGDRVLAVNGEETRDHAAATGLMKASPEWVEIEIERKAKKTASPRSPLARLSKSRSRSSSQELQTASAAAPAAPPRPTTHIVRVRRGPGGLGLDMQDNFVLSVVEGSPAFEDKALRAGDEVLEVEGESLGAAWLADVLSTPRLRVLPALSFKVRRGGAFKPIQPIQLPAGPMPVPTLQRDGTVKQRASVDARLAGGWQPSPAAAPAPAVAVAATAPSSSSSAPASASASTAAAASGAAGPAESVAAELAASAVAGAASAASDAPPPPPALLGARGRGVSQQGRQAALSAKAAAGGVNAGVGAGVGGRVLPGTQHVLLEAAEMAGVPLELARRIEAAGARAVLGSSWVTQRAASKHLLEPPMGIDEALRHAQSFPGAQRGWTLHFDDGSFLRLVRAGWRRDGQPLGNAEWSSDSGRVETFNGSNWGSR